MAWLYEAYDIDVVDSFYESHIDIFNEGVNIDNTKAFLAGRKEFKSELRAAKKSLRAKDKVATKKHMNNAKKALNDMESTIRKTEGSTSSTLCGLFAYGLLTATTQCIPFGGLVITTAISVNDMAKETPGALIGDIGTAVDGQFKELKLSDFTIKEFKVPEFEFEEGHWELLDDLDDASDKISKSEKLLEKFGNKQMLSKIGNNVFAIVAVIQALIMIAKDIIKLIEEIKDPKTKNEDAFNLYRNRLLQFCDKLNKEFSKMEEKANKAFD